ncbi:unnamed protein product [Acanthoscelides obtectus]|uniref:Uncharacterized protein n=1 Tax=Acanthoscelides obtectus TaxID=200917 RepID=A0A9P0LZH5_ACAOB|nr:unnamed protein product [Acanthoscelides obtectus]CAK1668565.1 hypothetical protein AOBTE_LOCUS26487 [Acanthoscelides obtectus]
MPRRKRGRPEKTWDVVTDNIGYRVEHAERTRTGTKQEVEKELVDNSDSQDLLQSEISLYQAFYKHVRFETTFADDTVILFEGTSWQEVEQVAEREIKRAYAYHNDSGKL